jgi:gluconolactonase
MTVEPFASAEIGSTALDHRGRLVMAGTGRVVRIDLQGKVIEVLGTGFTSVNDVIVRKDGTIYFTDPSGHRVWRITADKKAAMVAGMTKPNGIMLSHDESVLYVADSTDRLVRRFKVSADGALDGGALFASTGNADVPDGMCLDDAGNVYVTTIPGLLVFSAAGVRRGNIPIPGEGPTNCSFGGRDRKTLYVTTNRALWSIEMAVPGVP